MIPDDAPATAPDPDELISRLRVIEEQSLDSRAEAYNRVHDELQDLLSAGDIAAPDA